MPLPHMSDTCEWHHMNAYQTVPKLLFFVGNYHSWWLRNFICSQGACGSRSHTTAACNRQSQQEYKDFKGKQKWNRGTSHRMSWKFKSLRSRSDLSCSTINSAITRQLQHVHLIRISQRLLHESFTVAYSAMQSVVLICDTAISGTLLGSEAPAQPGKKYKHKGTWAFAV